MYLPKSIGIKQKRASKEKKSIYTKINVEVAPYEQPLEKISPFFPILSGKDDAIAYKRYPLGSKQ